MASRVETIPVGGGFFNPYARSVAQQAPAAYAPQAPASAEHALPPAPRADSIPRSGGVFNPFARSVDDKR